ncbi:MAG TPA: hypothetical protein VGG52_03965, partial [Chthoniobacterales bacterium]
FDARRRCRVRGAQGAFWRPAGKVIVGRSTPGCHEIRLASAKMLPTTSFRLAIICELSSR